MDSVQSIITERTKYNETSITTMDLTLYLVILVYFLSKIQANTIVKKTKKGTHKR